MKLILACYPGLERALFDDDRLARLGSVAEVLDPVPVHDLSEPRAEALLARADIMVSSWFCPRLDAALLARAPRLAFVAHAAGTVKDHVTPEVFARGIRVSSAAAANAVPVAEYTLAVILLANKRALWANQHWHATGTPPDIGPRVGNRGKRIAIVGASYVGRLVIEHLRRHEFEIGVYDPFLGADEARRLGVTPFDTLTGLCAWADLVSVHAPLLDETVGLIGAAELAAMRDGTVIVNTARGRIVAREPLERELTSGRLFGVIDTSDPEPLPADSVLRGCHNVFVTPHLAGSMGNEVTRMADLAIDEVARFVAGEPLRFEVHPADLERIA